MIYSDISLTCKEVLYLKFNEYFKVNTYITTIWIKKVICQHPEFLLNPFPTAILSFPKVTVSWTSLVITVLLIFNLITQRWICKQYSFVLFIFKFYLNEIRQYVLICNWLLSLCILSVRLGETVVHLVSLLCSIPLSEYNTIYSSFLLLMATWDVWAVTVHAGMNSLVHFILMHVDRVLSRVSMAESGIDGS